MGSRALFRFYWAPRALVVTLAACGGAGVATDAGPADLGTEADAAGVDTGPAADAGTPPEVAACEASVDAARADCAAFDPTSYVLCVDDAMRPLCASGRTAFVKAIFECLTGGCSTPAGLSDFACVQDAIHAAATSTDHAAGAAICACRGATPELHCDINEPAGSLSNVMLLSEADVAAYTSCLASMGCGMERACVQASRLGPAYAASITVCMP